MEDILKMAITFVVSGIAVSVRVTSKITSVLGQMERGKAHKDPGTVGHVYPLRYDIQHSAPPSAEISWLYLCCCNSASSYVLSRCGPHGEMDTITA